MKKKWLILIGVLLLFSVTFANKTIGMGEEVLKYQLTYLTLHLN